MSPQADRAPAFQFYPKDWDSDSNVIPMSYEEEGVYFALCRRYWLDGTLPHDLERLRKLLKGRPSLAKMQKWWDVIGPCFQVDGNSLTHKRLDRERESQREYREAKARAGSIGGRSRSAQANAKQNEAVLDSASSKTEANPSSSSSSSTPSPSASSSAVSFGQRRGAGAMGGSYLSQSTAAYIGARGVVIPPGKFYTEMLAKFDGDPLAFASWLDDVIARQPSGWKCGDVFRWVREQIDAQFNVKQGTTKTAGNVAAIQAFVRGGTR